MYQMYGVDVDSGVGAWQDFKYTCSTGNGGEISTECGNKPYGYHNPVALST